MRLVEEFKCAKTSLEMTLSQSKDLAVKNTAPTVKTGRKWNPVQHAQGALQHKDIIGQVQSGRAGFGLGDSWTAWERSPSNYIATLAKLTTRQ